MSYPVASEGAAGELPVTEASNPASAGIDTKCSEDVVQIIHGEDRRAWEALEPALGPLARAVDRVVDSFERGGRLVYVGAGTSGRLGVLDASECPPTFGVPSTLVEAVIAGGDAALRHSAEGAEDDANAGAAEMARLAIQERDTVCGIAVSGRTPFVWGALAAAAQRGADRILVTCNPQWREARARAGAKTPEVDVVIVLAVGPEVIAGSSRLKGGTATKLTLNSLTTAAMIRWGKVHDNLMVDVVPSNQKLRQRAVRLVAQIAAVETPRAERLLAKAGGRIKVAVLLRDGGTLEAASAALARHRGRLRPAAAELLGGEFAAP